MKIAIIDSTESIIKEWNVDFPAWEEHTKSVNEIFEENNEPVQYLIDDVDDILKVSDTGFFITEFREEK